MPIYAAGHQYTRPFAGDYLAGTGWSEGATGEIFAFGAIDLNKFQLTLRYEGTLCFEPVAPP